MTIVDRNILRSAIFELMFCPDVPTKVVLNEAIELGKRFSSEKSGSFINGILDRVSHQIVRSQPAD
jgi:N utilization substance protein B